MLSNYQQEYQLAESTLFIFTRFIWYEYNSSYQIWKYLASIGRGIAYKNVRKKIQRLASLNLIEIAKQSNKHNFTTIYYKLSTFGLFYIFYKRLIPVNLPVLIDNNKNNPMFEIFLYRLLEKHTLLSMSSPDGISAICIYLSDCSKKIGEILKKAQRHEREKYEETPFLYSWDDMPNKDRLINEMFINYLQTECKLQWLELDAQIQRIDNQILEVSSHGKKLYVQLDEKNQRVIFLFKKKQIGEVKVKPYGANLKEFFIYTKHPTSAQDVFLHANLDHFDDETEKLFISLTRVYQNDEFDEEKSRDYGILKNDKKFKNLIFLVNRKYRNYYNELADKLGLLAIA